MTSEWIDISQRLHNGIAEWPGDTPFSYEVKYSKVGHRFREYRKDDDEYAYGDAYRCTFPL